MSDAVLTAVPTRCSQEAHVAVQKRSEGLRCISNTIQLGCLLAAGLAMKAPPELSPPGVHRPLHMWPEPCISCSVVRKDSDAGSPISAPSPLIAPADPPSPQPRIGPLRPRPAQSQSPSCASITTDLQPKFLVPV